MVGDRLALYDQDASRSTQLRYPFGDRGGAAIDDGEDTWGVPSGTCRPHRSSWRWAIGLLARALPPLSWREVPQTVETADRFEVVSSLHVGVRVALAVMAAVPLLAPYELLVRVVWRDLASPAFAFAVLVSAGAVLVSGLLVGAAVAGTSSRIVLDRRSGTVARTAWAPAVRRSTRTYPLRDVVAVEPGVRDWSEGEHTYHVRLVLADDTVLETGPSRSRDHNDALRTRLVAFLAQGAGPVQHGSHD